MDTELIQQRIAELEQERDDFIKLANIEINRRVGAYEGAIAELRRWLEMMESEMAEPESDNG